MRKIEGMDLSIKDILDALRYNLIDLVELVDVDNDTEFENFIDFLLEYENLYKLKQDELSELPVMSEFDSSYDFAKPIKSEDGSHYIAQIEDFYQEFHSGNLLYPYRKYLEELVEHRCPICDCSFAYSQVTLDHLLPKSKYPLYSIAPINLVPTCYNCNMRKNDSVPSKLLHPYFHGFNTFEYLNISINVKEIKPFESTINMEFVDSGEDSDKKEKIENIKLYKLREKYLDLTNIAFLKILDEFQQVIRLKELEKDVYSIDRLKMLFKSLDNFIEIEGKYNFIDETFLRHLCIDVISNTRPFLNAIAKKLNDFDRYNDWMSNAITKLNEEVETSQYFHPDNYLSLMKEALPLTKFIGIYEFENDTFNLKRFQGPHQTDQDIFQFCPKEDYLENINHQKSFSTNQSMLLLKFNPKNVVGTEIVISLRNGKFCILLIEGSIEIRKQELEELEDLIQKFPCLF